MRRWAPWRLTIRLRKWVAWGLERFQLSELLRTTLVKKHTPSKPKNKQKATLKSQFRMIGYIKTYIFRKHPTHKFSKTCGMGGGSALD